MRPLATAAAVLALTAAAPVPHPAQKTAPPKLAVVRAAAESGSGQRARALAASSMPKYVALFPKTLVARVTGAAPQKGDRIVVFSCVEHGCAFVSADQPENGKYVDHVGRVYKVTVVGGRAKLNVMLAGDDPTASYTVTAMPSVHAEDGERAVAASFTLTMQ